MKNIRHYLEQAVRKNNIKIFKKLYAIAPEHTIGPKVSYVEIAIDNNNINILRYLLDLYTTMEKKMLGYYLHRYATDTNNYDTVSTVLEDCGCNKEFIMGVSIINI